MLPPLCGGEDDGGVAGVTGAVLAAVLEEVCVVDVPPLAVGWTVIVGWILIV